MSDSTIRRALDDLNNAKTASNHPFDHWELEFIESVNQKYSLIGSLTPKQREKLWELWEKI